MVLTCVLCPGRWASHPGAQWLRYHLDGLQSSRDMKVELLWPPGVRVGHTFSSWNNSFLRTLITKLISYYLKLKSVRLSPPSLGSLKNWIRKPDTSAPVCAERGAALSARQETASVVGSSFTQLQLLK